MLICSTADKLQFFLFKMNMHTIIGICELVQNVRGQISFFKFFLMPFSLLMNFVLFCGGFCLFYSCLFVFCCFFPIILYFMGKLQ